MIMGHRWGSNVCQTLAELPVLGAVECSADAAAFEALVGLVLKRDRDRCCATVQMLYDKEVMNFDYDSISEYVGDTSYHD
ncbi:hypothetical protein HPB47_022455 [Ixodes persulcatus]|uniref:Uncharacterized protein n=1 Tax=Ixodes persulcatus TaxID=34615 RepID=A0AC60Q9T2_IXOPE|nr:hypothetical protein HPB47_022455 [Ixodes persulcatus]